MLGPGLILVDKPVGPTSAQVVAAIRRMAKERRVGHGGTLDPFASGLLPILIGREFTKKAGELLYGPKSYIVTVRLGAETDTCDFTGRVVARGEGALPALKTIEAAVSDFIGEIEQIPPEYSALKLEGKPLYWYARKGLHVNIKPRTVTIHSIEIVEFLPPDIVLNVSCGKGAYMRALGRDLGRKLGCLGHLVALRRIRVGPYCIEDAIPLWVLVKRFNTDF